MSAARRRGGQGPPRSLATALEALRSGVSPQTLLAAVQEAWPDAAGPLAAAQGEPVAERAGVVTVACRSATWAQELDLMSPVLVAKVAAELADGPYADALAGLRFTAAGARQDPA